MPLELFAQRSEGRGQTASKAHFRMAGPHLLYGFLTTAPSAIVEPIHKAMPVIRTSDEEHDVWMRAVGRSQSAAASIAGRRARDRDAGRRQGRQSGGVAERFTSVSEHLVAEVRIGPVQIIRLRACDEAACPA
jgi:hypothetical protein